jgi:NADH-quinone oxidoreductase subunit L
MFLALGVGAWSAAIFHFMTHAFFKALLFLGAGVVIQVLHEEHDMFRMGGLRTRLPVTFWTFLIGSASLAALPLVTAGFYSKDLILWEAWSSPAGSPWLWGAGLAGALLTAVYTFRMVFLTFFGPLKAEVRRKPGLSMQIPLVILAVLSVVGGFVELPSPLGDLPLLSDFLQSALPAASAVSGGVSSEFALQLIAAAVSLLGIYLAYMLFLRHPQSTENLVRSRWGAALHRFWFAGWGFDRLYDRCIVQPYVWLARADTTDVIDPIYDGIAWLTQMGYYELSRTQTGQVRRYVMGIAIGVVIIIAIVVFV